MNKIMKQEQKELLLKDLSARLPYGVKFPTTWPDPITSEPIETTGAISYINRYGIVSFVWDYEGEEILVKDSLHIKDIKPYLFPLSSMTEEQQKEYRKACDLDMEILENRPMKGEPFPALYNSQDWLDAHHFDYRNLIPMGLANDATGLNIYD